MSCVVIIRSHARFWWPQIGNYHIHTGDFDFEAINWVIIIFISKKGRRWWQTDLCWIVEEIVTIARDEILIAKVAFTNAVQRFFFQLCILTLVYMRVRATKRENKGKFMMDGTYLWNQFTFHTRWEVDVSENRKFENTMKQLEWMTSSLCFTTTL